jgi:ABC-type transport system involved in multi-copper enzyme maturation permease subunit
VTTITVASARRSSRYGLRQACRAEWAKLFSVRSTWWTLFVTVVGTLVVTALSTSSVAHHGRGWYHGFDPTNQSMSGLTIGALAIGVLAVLVFTSEYGSGTIRSSMAATPRRLKFLLAKLLVVGALALAVGEGLTFSCFALGHAILGSSPVPSWSLTDPGVLRAVVGSGVTIGLLGLMGAAIGAAVRGTAGAIGIYVALFFLLPLLLTKVPGNLARLTPLFLIANSIAAVVHQTGFVSPIVGFVLFACYTAAIILLGAVVVNRRDP